MAVKPSEEQRKYLSGPQLLERWGLDHLDHAQQVRFLQTLRERRLIQFRHITLRHIVYDLEGVIRLEEKNITPSRPESAGAAWLGRPISSH